MGAKPFKVEELLSAAELEELDAFVRDRLRSVDEVHEWLLARQFTVGRSSVGRWKASVDERIAAERFGRSSELARAIKGAVKDGKFEDVADAAVMQLTQVVFEQAARLEENGELDALTVQRWTKSLTNLVGSKGGVDELKQRQIAAVEEADKVAKSGASGEAVANKMRELLGLKS